MEGRKKMPKSLKCMIKTLCHQGKITDEEKRSLLYKLRNHDAELLSGDLARAMADKRFLISNYGCEDRKRILLDFESENIIREWKEYRRR